MTTSGEQRLCPKCNAMMEGGFLLNRLGWGPTRVAGEQQEWVEGEAGPKSFWTGSVPLRGKVRRKVLAYRCHTCGYLELYAPGAG